MEKPVDLASDLGNHIFIEEIVEKWGKQQGHESRVYVHFVLTNNTEKVNKWHR